MKRVTDILKEKRIVVSTSEARRLIAQKAILLDDAIVSDISAEVPAGQHILKIGKHKSEPIKVDT